MPQRKITDYTFICFLLLFAHSGLVKWLFAPIDPTILFAILCLPSLFVWSKFKFYFNGNPLMAVIPIFLFFNLSLIATIVYTISDKYYIFKSIVIISNIAVCLFPLLVINSEESISRFNRIFKTVFFIALLFLSFQYIDNQFIIIRFHPDENGVGIVIPDYLTFSYFLGSGIIFLLDSKDLLSRIMIFTSLIFMILLAAKGPLLFLIIVTLIKYRRKISLFKLKFWLSSLVVLLSLLFLIMVVRVSLFDALLGRLIFFSDGLDADKSSLARVILLNNGIELIKNNPIFGVGLGSFAKAIGDTDGRLSPHNIFVEVWAECGLIPFIVLIILCSFFFKKSKLVMNKYNFSNGENIIYLCLFLFMGNMVSAYLEDLRITYFWLGVAIAFYSVRIRTLLKLY